MFSSSHRTSNTIGTGVGPKNWEKDDDDDNYDDDDGDDKIIIFEDPTDYRVIRGVL